MKNLSNKTLQATYGGDVIGGSVVPGKLGAFSIFEGGVSMGSGKEFKEKKKQKKFSENEFEKWARKNGVEIKDAKGGAIAVFKPKPKKKKPTKLNGDVDT